MVRANGRIRTTIGCGRARGPSHQVPMPISSLVFQTMDIARNAAHQDAASMICHATVSWPGASGGAGRAGGAGIGPLDGVEIGAGGGSSDGGDDGAPSGFVSMEASVTTTRVGAVTVSSPAATLRLR